MPNSSTFTRYSKKVKRNKNMYEPLSHSTKHAVPVTANATDKKFGKLYKAK